jgi:plastocyanin domain-containing protein
MKKNMTIAAVSLIAIIGGGALAMIAEPGKETAPAAVSPDGAPSANVHVENGQQIIEISAKGGYAPLSTVARAGIPTIIRINTNSTFDCSISFTLPGLNYRTRLPFTGTTDILVPVASATGELTGLCSMGMYSFSVKFRG